MWLDFLVSTDIITEKLYCLSSLQENDPEDQFICVCVCVWVCVRVLTCACLSVTDNLLCVKSPCVMLDFIFS